MNNGKIQSQTGVTLVGAGSPSRQDIDDSKEIAPTVVAADGGANYCVEYGITPNAVIGDFDSVSPETRATLRESILIEVTDIQTIKY